MFRLRLSRQVVCGRQWDGQKFPHARERQARQPIPSLDQA